MLRCAREGLESGAESVVIVGSDIPGVGADILTKAFDALRNHDLVIGPATDGGYYLMEHFEMVRRLKRRGRVSIVPVPAVTSARRWRKRGIISPTSRIRPSF